MTTSSDNAPSPTTDPQSTLPPGVSSIGSGSVIAAILRYDTKITTYKIALLRALNDVVLAFPGFDTNNDTDNDTDNDTGTDNDSNTGTAISPLVPSPTAIAVPLRFLADRWIAYYWPFVAASGMPAIPQGQQATRQGATRSDMSFRPALTALRAEWEQRVLGSTTPGRPSDGFYLVADLQLSRKRAGLPPELLAAYTAANRAICKAIQQPIRYAGPPGQEHSVFPPPQPLAKLLESSGGSIAALPGSDPKDLCLSVPIALWSAFRELSLYVEALCIHEWALFTERMTSVLPVPFTRGDIYTLLTDRPDNRRPLSWERNQVDILLMEGKRFTCPWTFNTLTLPKDYDLDHLVPVSVYPINALWNLVPADPHFNSHVKRDRLPGKDRLLRAGEHILGAYRHYNTSSSLSTALVRDAGAYFDLPLTSAADSASVIARSATAFIERITAARNLPTF